MGKDSYQHSQVTAENNVPSFAFRCKKTRILRLQQCARSLLIAALTQ